MRKKQESPYTWFSQKKAKDCEEIECPDYDPYKDFKRDPTGYYVLIKTQWDILRISVAICNKDNEVIKIFKGKRAQDLYHTIFQYEKKHNLEWFKEKFHVAYLGKELKKAELALVIGVKDYFQE